MREVNFTNEELKEVKKGNFIASGSEASIYKYKKYVALRLYDVQEDGLFCPVTGKMIGRPACEELIKNLHVYKDNIKLSSFPIGIVKVNDIVIGQLIKYYKNSITLTDFFKSSPSVDPIDYYMKILDILEELALNGIAYDDVHGGNFLIVGDKLRIIDFSEYRMKVGQKYKGVYRNMFENFNTMVNRLNFKVLHLDDVYNKLIIPSDIKDSYENLEESFDYVRSLLSGLEKDEKVKSR